MRDEARNYVAVGVFVVAMLAGLVLWIALLSGRTGATDAYTIRYDDVTGLAEGTQIYFDGFPIGRIDAIEPSHDGNDQLFRLDVSIERGWKIPEDSVAEITASGLLAASVVNIQGGDSAIALEPGDQIPSVEAANVVAVVTDAASGLSDFLVDSLKPEIEGIVADLRRAIEQINSVLGPKNTGRVARILENLENASQEIDGLTDGLGDTRRQLDQVLAQMNELVAGNEDELSHAIVDLHESLEALARRADSIADNLEFATRNLNEFSQQIRENPGVLLRGRSPADEPTEAVR